MHLRRISVTSLFNFAYAGGTMLGPLLAGFLYDLSGFGLVMICFSAIVLCVSPILMHCDEDPDCTVDIKAEPLLFLPPDALHALPQTRQRSRRKIPKLRGIMRFSVFVSSADLRVAPLQM